MDRIAERGKFLLDKYRVLDDRIVNYRFLEHEDDRLIQQDFKTLNSEIKKFNVDSDEFIKDADTYANSKLLLSKNRDHEDVNDFDDIDAPLLKDFYTYGLTLKQVLKELDKKSNGNKAPRERNGKFHYIVKERVIYRDFEEMEVRSRRKMRETFVEMVFKTPTKWVPENDIDDERQRRYGSSDSSGASKDWIRKAHTALNKQARTKFSIDYDLFEREQEHIRLNPKAR